MAKRSKPSLRTSLLSYAIAAAAGSSLANAALAVDLCTGKVSTSVSSSASGSTCSLDTTDAKLSVGAGGVIGDAVYGAADGVSISNAGVIRDINDSSSYYATAVYLDRDLTGNISNSGSISALSNGTSSGYYAQASAIYISGDVDGSFSNSGSIKAEASAERANAYAVNISGDVSGTISNSGSILTVANAESSSAYASSLYIGGNLSGTLNNSGTISAIANSVSSSAEAYGVYISGDVSATGKVTNSGVISAEANSSSYSATAYGMEIDGVVEGAITNSGTISATGFSLDSSAGAYALYLSNGLKGGVLKNTGTIVASAEGDDDSYATGLYMGSHYVSTTSGGYWAAMTGDAQLVNSGKIIGLATSHWDEADAWGVWLSGDLRDNAIVLNTATGSIRATVESKFSSATATAVYTSSLYENAQLVNKGLIEASATSTYSSAYAAAIDTGSLNDNASLVNQGKIVAIANGNDSATAYGIRVEGLNDSASLTNSGTITAIAKSGGSSATAYGIEAYDLNGGSITNSGTIAVEAHGWSTGSAYGISTSSLSNGGAITNSGTISAIATDKTSTAYAYGIETSSLSGASSITNSGVVVAKATGYTDASAYAYALYVGDLTDSSITNSGKIVASAVAGGVYNYASAYGIYSWGGLSGASSINNSGTILASASATSTVSAYGIYTGSLSGTSSIINSGLISATANAGIYEASAYGIRTSSLSDSASIQNSGVVRALANGSTSASAYGISAGDLSGTASISNSGAILAAAVNTHSSSAYAYGVSVSRLSDSASISNTGTIIATASDKSGRLYESAEAMGIYLYELGSSATLNNSGTIAAQADSIKGTASAYGIYATGISGTVQNSGTIVAVGNSNGASYGIYVSGGGIYNGTGTSNGTVDNQGEMVGGAYLNSAYSYTWTWNGSTWVYTQGPTYTVSLTNSGSITTFANSPSYVSGDYTQGAGGSLTFVLQDLSTYGSLQVDGTADFTASNKVVIRLDPNAMLADGDVFTNVVYANTLTAPAGFAVTDTSLFWNFTKTEHANGFDLEAEQVDVGSALAGSGLNLSPSLAALVEKAVSGQLGSDYAALAGALNSASSAAAAAKVLEQINPALSGGAAQATRVATAGASNAISARVAETRGASSGDAFQNGAVWLKPFIGVAEQDDANGVSGYDVDTTGLVLGVDGDLTDTLRAGVALASAESEASGTLGGVDVAVTQFTLYGAYALDDRTAVDMDLSYAMNEYDSSRNAFGSPLTASFDGEQLGLGVALSRSYKLNEKAALVPSVGVRYDQINLDGYTEVGVGGSQVGEQDEDSILVAAKGAYELTMAHKGVFSASLGVAYNDVDAASVTSTLGNGTGPTFVTTGIEPESMVLTAGLGYRYVTSKNLEINAAYDVESRDDFLGQTASVKFKLPF